MNCFARTATGAWLLTLVTASATQCGGDQDPPPVGKAPAPAAAPQDPPPATDLLQICVGGNLQGRLEPCGCASGQLGGLARRSFQIGLGNYDLLLEVGGLAEGHDELELQKWFTSVSVLFGMKRPYDALGVAASDLELPYGDWSGYLSAYKVPVVASDLVSEDKNWPAVAFLDKTVRQHRVRIASFTLTVPPAAVTDAPKVKVLEPAAAWKRALAGAADEALRILFVHGDGAVARTLAGSLQPLPDLVIAGDAGMHEPPGRPELVGAVPVVYPGIRGRMLLDLSLVRLQGRPRLGYAVVPLAGSQTSPGAQEDPSVRDAILKHRQDVAAQHVLQEMAEKAPTPNGAAYVGSQACQACHPQAVQTWQASKHGHAWEVLVDAEKKRGWPVTAYPDCVRCHVVGYGQKSGFVDATKTPDLAGVGCERCHGPASEHVRSNGTAKLGKVGAGAPSTVCAQCHDFEQSPTFVYGDRWPLIKHGKL